ncbi:LuxR C-terminal-related transcriptional regulator [Enterobacter hormaechei]|uniref:helix-turn-helix domain-containing protein n=1 Tax=Enterobacter hormaechei TaxID=158836 RepID=UPI002863E462|nr:LuxR C-terminal-related transcriptional regulator [Enterobacter hormaechei]ELD3465547.1 response regulator transcription factor [Enterobacter hormaechei]MED5730720.1 LuxR C-terminal-related transcriptional regulator [Enterobacter hormaechei]HDR1982577.1 response regulator transcription factor [Enterobacter hormaechei]
MNFIFISDNYYLCHGVSSALTSTCLIRDDADIHDLNRLDPAMDFIIAIEQDKLRNKTIQQVKKVKRDYIVLMHEIEANSAVRIDNIIYSSMHFTAHPFQQLMRFYRALRTHSFTRREYDVLKLFHMENHEIAKKLKLSQKTTSTYRVRILEKLNMRSKNILAMSRIKSAIVDQKL